MMSFLRGGMKPRSGVAAALVAAEAAVSTPCGVRGFVFAVAAPAAPEPCDTTVEDTVEDFFAAAFSDEDPAEVPCAALAVSEDTLDPVVVAPVFAVLSAAAEVDAEPVGAELPAGGGEDVAGAAAVAAGLLSVAGFDAVCAAPESEGGVAVAMTAFTASWQGAERLARWSLRHWKASVPPRGTPQQLDMKSDRQLALTAASCSSVGFAEARTVGHADASAKMATTAGADAKILI
jgi:hypothetical protein